MWSEVLDHLAAADLTVATAESLTGGLLAARVTDVPGASRSFLGGVVSYDTGVKQDLLGVPADVVDRYGVVSRQCAEAMARGVRERLHATYGVSTTGVAGPDEQEGKAAGTVWIAVAGPLGEEARLLDLSGSRADVREATCEAAVVLLAGTLRREDPGLG